MYLQSITTPTRGQSKSDEFFDFPHPPSSLLEHTADIATRELKRIFAIYEQRINEAFREAASVPERNQYAPPKVAFKDLSADVAGLATLTEESLRYKRGLIARMERADA
jgi:hypothetical protein